MADQNRILELLDRAYSTSEDGENFSEFLDSASVYLFDSPDGKTLNSKLPRYAGFDPHLENHIDRLNRLINRPDGTELGLSLNHHAQIVLSPKGEILSMNDQAQSIIGLPEKPYLDYLDVAEDTRMALREILAELRAGVQKLQRVIHIRTVTNIETPQSLFGFCNAVTDDDADATAYNVLHISLSAFEWSNQLLDHLQSALGLTQSEKQILHGVLQGKSQKEIAIWRGRSLDTVKAQSKSILKKANCSKMTDLAHLSTSIAYIIGLSELVSKNQRKSKTWEAPRHNLRLLNVGANRQLGYYEYGNAEGIPVLFIHGYFQGPFFQDRFKRRMLKSGIRLICPSRPGFGYSSAPAAGKSYEDSVQSDLLALIEHLGISETLPIVAHHAGAVHAVRLAAKLGPQVSSILMLGVRIPTTPEHLAEMSQHARLISTASRHAPSVVKMIMSVGLKTYKKKGARAFFENQFQPDGPDAQNLNDAESYRCQAEGLGHFIHQGTDALVNDSGAFMKDWTDDFDKLECQVHWIHGRHCHVMKPEFVKAFAQLKGEPEFTILEDAGFCLLYQCPDLIAQKIENIAD